MSDTTGTNGQTGPAVAHTTPALWVRALWFVFVGWWLVGIWLTVSWFLLVTIIGAPIGIKLLNYTPKVVSLKERSLEQTLQSGDQPSLLVRAVYFVLVGWWASALWASVAYLFTVSIIGIPVAIWMYTKLPAVVSLYRY